MWPRPQTKQNFLLNVGCATSNVKSHTYKLISTKPKTSKTKQKNSWKASPIDNKPVGEKNHADLLDNDAGKKFTQINLRRLTFHRSPWKPVGESRPGSDLPSNGCRGLILRTYTKYEGERTMTCTISDRETPKGETVWALSWKKKVVKKILIHQRYLRRRIVKESITISVGYRHITRLYSILELFKGRKC